MVDADGGVEQIRDPCLEPVQGRVAVLANRDQEVDVEIGACDRVRQLALEPPTGLGVRVEQVLLELVEKDQQPHAEVVDPPREQLVER